MDLETYFDMGYLQSKLTVDLSCVNVLVRPTRARVSPRQSGAARPCVYSSKYPSGGCKARIDRRLRTAVCSAGWVESLNLQGRITIAVPTVHASVSGCEGSSIAVLCSVASRVARET